MKSLRQSLIDYEIVLLNAIAACRAVPLNSLSQAEIVDRLTVALLSPVAMAIALDDLSPAEKEALHFLIERGGEVEGPRFSRQYGVVRSMGPARLERERPWETPVNPAEGLWYRGFIFKAFQVVSQGGQELIYIPSDLMPLLTDPVPSLETEQTLEFPLAATPNVILNTSERLRENMFSLLVYLQTTPVRVPHNNNLQAKQKQALSQQLLPPFLPSFTPTNELDFLLHLSQRSGLLTIAYGRLRPARNEVRHWLQADPGQQLQQLQNSWRADPSWNDLWHVPGLFPQATGWENSPLRARSKILEHLEQIPLGKWLSITGFINHLKRIDPDFQRPNGDYESWYIQNAQGDFLMGFEHWEAVDGALIRYLLTYMLPLLGVLDLGCRTEKEEPIAFRLLEQGQTFLSELPPLTPTPRKAAFLRINQNFYVRVPLQVTLYDRFQLARFADLERREENKIVYHINQSSISRAVKNGVTAEQIIAFLTRATNSQIPLKVVETLRLWGTRYATAKLEQVTILRLDDDRMIAELRQNPVINHLLGESLGPKIILIPNENVAELRRFLTDAGYLE